MPSPIILAFVAACLLTPAGALAQDPLPRHMEAARAFFADLKPENTHYLHSRTGLVWREPGKGENSAVTDCSGFVTDVLNRVGSSIPGNLFYRINRVRPLSADYYRGITSGRGFERIEDVAQIRAGDVIAWVAVGGRNVTDHVMFVDSQPVRVRPYAPLAEGTVQWEFWVMDSTQGVHSIDDTRYRKDGPKATGVGRGRIRLYVDAATGAIVGKANARPTARYYDESSVKIAVGRVGG